jgi:hypothetical protein
LKEEIFNPGLGEEGFRVLQTSRKHAREEILERFRVLQTAKKKKNAKERERERF